MKFAFHALKWKDSRTLKTDQYGGTAKITRTEWGIGKGQMKRAIKALDLKGGVLTITTRYWLIGARYTVYFQGWKSVAERVYATK